MDYVQVSNGEKSKEVAKLKVEDAIIYFEEKNYDAAIEKLDVGIGTLKIS